MDLVEEKHAIAMVSQLGDMHVKRGFLGAKPSYVKAWYKYGLRDSSETDPYPTIRAEYVDDLCAEARKDADVFSLVKFFSAKRLRGGGRLPPAISELIEHYLLDEFSPTGPGSGRRKNWGRDIIILAAMKEVLRTYDVVATHRRKLSTDPSRIRKTGKAASEIVQAALRETIIGSIDVHRIHRIWENGEKQDAFRRYCELQIQAEFDDESEAKLV